MYGAVLWGGVLSGDYIFPPGVLPLVPSTPTVTAPAQLRLISERAPLRLSMNIMTPDGNQTRWSIAETNPLKTHQGLTFTTTLPGGFEHCDVTLIRDPRRFFHDLRQLEKITIYGVGGSIAWQGRLETVPSISGDQLALTPGAVGYQSALADDASARELYVENDITKWQNAFLDRELYFAINGPWDLQGSLVTGNPADPVNPYIPALTCQVQGPWTRTISAEGWYDAQGLPIGSILWEAIVAVAGNIGNQVLGTGPGNNWIFDVGLSSDDALATSPDGGVTWTADTPGVQYDHSGNFWTVGGYTWSGTVTATTSDRAYAFVLAQNSASGTSGITYSLYFRKVTLVGNQNNGAGLPLYDSDVGGTGSASLKGVLGSDVLKHAVPKYAPEIAVTRQGMSTIQPSSFVIPELVFTTPGTVADMIKAVSAFELQDWGVWEGDGGKPVFYWYPRGTMGRHWRSRMGPAKLQSTGPQIDRLFNGVIVNFTDFSGISRTVGPGGTGVPTWAVANTTYHDPSLIDLDPQNPLNEWGEQLRKWAPITMNASSTLPQAIIIGAAFLKEQKIRNTSGSAQINGYIEDSTGVTWPAWKIRAGDHIAFIDAADSSYRRIVSTSYNDDTHINTITLDSPPDSLQAILSRLQVGLGPVIGG